MHDLPLSVSLAGFNIDADTLRELVDAACGDPPPGGPPAVESLTPETLSAAYARISHNPADVSRLREISRKEVEQARKSNENIIFGLGHSSVAEHAVFNIDVTGISRLAVESVERHRLASFTEKSQRYIKLDGDMVVAPEIRESGFEERFEDLIARQNDAYFALYPKLLEYFTAGFAERGVEKPRRQAKAIASEDARYVASLATQAQFGMTINARTLECMVRATTAHPLREIRSFGKMLAGEVQALAPSLVKYVEATGYERDRAERTAWWSLGSEPSQSDVTLLDSCAEGEEKVLAALIASREGCRFSRCLEKAKKMDRPSRDQLVRETLKSARQWDTPPREFEMSDFTFELVLSASAYAQLKRHRMATQLAGPYDPALGWTTPQSIREIGATGIFDEVMAASSELAERIAKECEAAAAYALTNAHRRRVIFKANVREMYHFSRLREDLSAQWDIRSLARQMVALAREKMPSLMLMAGGKHEFQKCRERVYGTNRGAKNV